MVELSPDVQAMLRSKNFWLFTTINPDGSPTTNPVWVDLDGQYVIVNTAVGRLKERNTRNEPRVALAVTDPADPYSWIEIRGVVAERIEGDEASESIDRLARKYLGVGRDEAGVPGTGRVLLKIEPLAVFGRKEPGPSTADG
jgi:PPOX class probable F420-dependent enzyme